MISLTGVAKHYGERTLFAGVNLTLGVSERVGLVGPNGCGKSTLLQILDGSLDPDEGVVSRNKRVRVGMLRQEVVGARGRRVLDEMLSGDEEMSHLESRIALLEEEMRGTSDPTSSRSLTSSRAARPSIPRFR